jgi:hypothetical protein
VLKGHASITNIRQGGEFMASRFDAMRADVEAARAEVDPSIGRTKSRGVFFRKNVTRNRVLANDFVTSTYLVGGGSFRAIGSLKLLADTVQTAKMGASAKISSGTAQKAIGTLRAYKQKRAELDDMLTKYNGSLKAASGNVGRLRTKGTANATYATDLAQALSAIADRAVASRDLHDKQIDNADVDAVIDTLSQKTQPEPQQAKVQPSQEAKGRGRKPLIGSRGKK